MKFIKRTHIKTVCNIDCYETNKYEVRISKDYEGKIEIRGFVIGDKEGLYYPTFSVFEGNFLINSYGLKIRLNNIDEFIEVLRDLKQINESLPELIKLGEKIPLPE